jgi:glycosyltransferase involved in cell wall biosynthesis
MPVFNADRFLAEAIESILSQTLRDYEFIIIDDGSTDNTPRILEDYARKDSRIRVIRQENRRIVGALNRGVEAARAPLLARMDADDVSRPQRFEVQVEFFDRHPEFSALGSSIRVIDDRGKGSRIIHHPEKLANLSEAVVAPRLMAHPSVMMKTSVIRSVGRYREVCGDVEVEDTDLWFRLVPRGPIGSVRRILLDYRELRRRRAPHLRLKEFVVRGLAYERLKGRPSTKLEQGTVYQAVLVLARRALEAEPGERHPWMRDLRLRRVLRDLFLLEPQLKPHCRRLLSRLAIRQMREFSFFGAAKTVLYGV